MCFSAIINIKFCLVKEATKFRYKTLLKEWKKKQVDMIDWRTIKQILNKHPIIIDQHIDGKNFQDYSEW